MRRFLLVMGLLVASSSGALTSFARASTYHELGDAPPLLPGQFTIAISPLELIHGTLADSADVDLYRIVITNPVAFSATVVAGSLVDSQLFLFNAGTMGVSHDDDTPPGAILPSTLGSIVPPLPGVYYLAISGFNRDPTNGAALIWLSDPPNVERPPDGPGSPGPLFGWSGTGVSAGGDYWIQLTGCDAFIPTPQPGMWNETGDAGDVVPGQTTTGVGALNWIYGALVDTLDVDAYCISITNPALFSASVNGPPEFDSQLFLFNGTSAGITFNDDDPAGGTPLSKITGASVPGPGVYVLAISAFDRDAVGPAASPMWLDTPFSTERVPDGPGALGPFAGWLDSGIGTGFYGITLMGAVFCSAPTAVPRDGAPRVLSISASPNPFNPTVRIACELPEPGRVRLAVYDAGGRRVRTLADQNQSKPQLSVTWNGRDDGGAPVASGIYFVRVESAHQVKTLKITLLK